MARSAGQAASTVQTVASLQWVIRKRGFNARLRRIYGKNRGYVAGPNGRAPRSCPRSSHPRSIPWLRSAPIKLDRRTFGLSVVSTVRPVAMLQGLPGSRCAAPQQGGESTVGTVATLQDHKVSNPDLPRTRRIHGEICGHLADTIRGQPSEALSSSHSRW